MLTTIGAFLSITFLYPLIIPGIILGIAAVAGSNFLPATMLPYRLLIQIGGIVLILLFVYLAGQKSSEDEWKVKMAAVEVENAELRATSSKVTTEVVVKYITKIKEVEKIRTEYVYVDKIITPEMDAKYPLPNAFIRLYNNSLKGNVPGATSGTNGASRTTKPTVESRVAPGG
jgi:hypothetical protein